MSELTLERLREIISYDPETGVFVWLVRTSRSIHVGDVAGSFDSLGYRRIKIEGRDYNAHRLAWLWMAGEWPAAQIDHINGDCGDNRWTNLREATTADNQHNVGKRSDNTSGFKGVTLEKRDRKWYARIQKNGKRHRLGSFDTPAEAHTAYCRAAAELHGAFARTA